MIVKRIPKVFKLRKARLTVFNFMGSLFNQSRSFVFYKVLFDGFILIVFVSLSLFFIWSFLEKLPVDPLTLKMKLIITKVSLWVHGVLSLINAKRLAPRRSYFLYLFFSIVIAEVYAAVILCLFCWIFHQPRFGKFSCLITIAVSGKKPLRHFKTCELFNSKPNIRYRFMLLSIIITTAF